MKGDIMSQIFEMLAKEVYQIDSDLKDYNNCEDQNIAKEKCKKLLTDIEHFTERFIAVYDQYIDKHNSEVKDLEMKASDLQKEIELYQVLSNKYKEENEMLREALNNQMAVVDRAASLMDLIESRINVVANSVAITKRMKDHRLSGEESPRYLHGIDVDELVEMYKAAGFKLTDDILTHFRKNNPKLNYMTLRDRLVKAGVWRGRQSKTAD